MGRMGGKRRLAKRLIAMFPVSSIYVEPFLGAGNIFLRLPKRLLDKIQFISLNDLDKDVWTIFVELQKNGDWINEHLNREIPTKEEFDELLVKTDVCSLIRKYKYSFLTQGKAFDKTKKYKINTNFVSIGEKLKNAVISNGHFATQIHMFDTPDTFFYLDPPYENEKQTDYDNYVTPEEVFNALENLQGKFLLSYNDSPHVREVFKKYNIQTITTLYSPNKNTKYKPKQELVITNYTVENKEDI